MCSDRTPDCYQSRCSNCPETQRLRDALLSVLDEHDIENVSYAQWVLKPRATLETHITCTDEFVDEFCERAKKLLQHHFIAKQQSQYLKSRRDNLTEGECLVICDFAENYAFIAQDAAPGFHWNNDQVTIYPVVVYYKSGDAVLHKSLVVISDCLHHDAVAVHVFTKITVDFIKTEIIQLPKRIVYFSDGAPQQFKNFKNFINLYNHEADFGVSAEWHFFATAHGKGPCDGVGGTLKRLLARASLRLPADQQILTPQDAYRWVCLPGSVPSISKRFSTNEDYNVAKETLKPRFENAKSIPNTQKQHCFIPTAEGMISKVYSAAEDFELHKLTKKN